MEEFSRITNRSICVGPTPRQKAWRERVYLLWRVKGMVIPMNAPMTEEEKTKLNLAQTLIKEVINNFTFNSVELGFNATERCHYCGKPAVTTNHLGLYVCNNHTTM